MPYVPISASGRETGWTLPIVAGWLAMGFLLGCSDDESGPPINVDRDSGADAPAVADATGGALPDAPAGSSADAAGTTDAGTPVADAGLPPDGAISPGPDAEGQPDGGDGGAPGACAFAEAAHSLLSPLPHVDSIEGQVYTSNPPSSGPHCRQWGAWTFYRAPLHLPRCNYIHNLGNGGIVILFRAREPSAELDAWLSGVLARATPDPDCPAPRILVSSDPEIDVPVAAAAWGFTFKADCPTPEAADALVAFINRHWGTRGMAPERNNCQAGTVQGVPF